MSTPVIPTPEQISASRAKLWHQSGDPLLTLEGLRAWLNQAGLVLFSPRAQQMPSPAPSVVEAVLGRANQTPTLAESEEARTLAMRLVAEGSAVPLNLLSAGATGDAPDFLCSAQVFSYVFTLRGDKAWKQPPATSGAVKVSPLALATYELLAAPAVLSAAELATELGKEVTEAAVLRGLTELWSQLRVLPVPQADGPVLWELMSTRFTKQIKAGANAGQPSALSALISLYLGMAVVASEDEIETILSPLAPRSRIRDVVHALMGARQLETMAVQGRTVVHISGDLPSFGIAKEPGSSGEIGAGETIEVEAVEQSRSDPQEAPASRITKFVPKPRKLGTGPAKSFNVRPRPGGGEAGRERRPFVKNAPETSRPSFTKPWEENRPARPRENGDGGGEARSARPSFRDKPSFQRNDGGIRPTVRRDDGAPVRREFTPREGGEQRPARKTFSKPGTFGRKREESAGRTSAGAEGARPARREFNARPGASNAGPRARFGGDRPDRTERSDRADAPKRPFADRPGTPGERRPGSYSPRPSGGGDAVRRKPYAPREEGSGPPAKKVFGAKAPFSRDRDAGTEGPRKVFRKFDAPRPARPGSDRPRTDGPGAGRSSTDRPRAGRPDDAARERPKSFAGKPGGFAGKKPFARPGSKPPGTFAKFADGNKPFRKPGNGGKSFSGKARPGAAPAFRKRKPEAGEA